MTDTFNEIKEELKIYYPAFTDDELTEMTENLLSFYKIAVKAVLEQAENLLSFYKIAVKAVLEQDNQDLNQEAT